MLVSELDRLPSLELHDSIIDIIVYEASKGDPNGLSRRQAVGIGTALVCDSGPREVGGDWTQT